LAFPAVAPNDATFQVRVLLLDIETSPSLAYIWSLWDQSVPLIRVEAVTEVMCFAAKWQGERSMHFYSTFIDGHEEMIAAAHRLLDEADVVIHYNGERFDIPHLNREFLLYGMTPPAPYRQIDLFRTVKRRFKFVSNKLEHVSTQLGLAGKAKHEGFDLWRKCIEGDESAWRRMERYNRQDVKMLEDLYLKLQPWIPNHPHRGLYDGEGGCPACSGTTLHKRGFAVTQTSTYQRYRCADCGVWLRSAKRAMGTDMRQVVL
jgi:hypothetical protein